MELFLLRHGSANPDAPRDSERTLNARGREEVHRNLSAHQALLQGVTHVLVSPYVRAQQTCEIALEYLPQMSQGHISTVEFLTPCGNPQDLLDYLYQNAFASVLCVSHQPLLGTLVDDICGFEPGQYRVGTGALARITFADVVAKGMGELQWLK